MISRQWCSGTEQKEKKGTGWVLSDLVYELAERGISRGFRGYEGIDIQTAGEKSFLCCRDDRPVQPSANG